MPKSVSYFAEPMPRLKELIIPLTWMQESKLYGAHFREIAADAPKAKKITFDSDNED